MYAAIADLCCGGQASATPDTRWPVTSAIKHSVILVTLSALALLTTRTAWIPIRFEVSNASY